MHAYTKELDDSMDDLRSSCDLLDNYLATTIEGDEEFDVHLASEKAEFICRKLRKAYQKFTFNWHDVRDETEARKDEFTDLIQRVILLFENVKRHVFSKPLQDHYESALNRQSIIDALVHNRTEEYRMLLRRRILEHVPCEA